MAAAAPAALYPGGGIPARIAELAASMLETVTRLPITIRSGSDMGTSGCWFITGGRIPGCMAPGCIDAPGGTAVGGIPGEGLLGGMAESC